MLSSLLNRVFPGVADSAADGCWVAKAIISQRKELDVFSEALTEVEKWEELQSLETKLQREHPLDRDHDSQYDRAVRDILTEACAFAWASSRGFGPPKFWDAEGTPDIFLETGNWIEVKAVHASDEEADRTRLMLAGEVVSGHAIEPGPGLYRKFHDSLMDAVKKFLRQDTQQASGPNIVFFNLTGLDTPSMVLLEGVKENLCQWADKWESTVGQAEGGLDVKLVMCFRYQWQSPFRECL